MPYPTPKKKNKAILIFPKNFLGFGLDTIEKQSNIFLSSYNS